MGWEEKETVQAEDSHHPWIQQVLLFVLLYPASQWRGFRGHSKLHYLYDLTSKGLLGYEVLLFHWLNYSLTSKVI